MVKSASDAADAYENGIEDRMGGFGPYEDAAGAETPEEAAEILQDARESNVSLRSAKSAYENAYN